MPSTVSPDQDAVDPDDYEINQPGLIVARLQDGDCKTYPGSRLLSVVRSVSADIDPAQLAAVTAMTASLEVFFKAEDEKHEVTLYKLA